MSEQIVIQILADARPATIGDRMSALGITPHYVKSYRRRPQPLAKRIKACKFCQRTAGGVCGRHRKASGVKE